MRDLGEGLPPQAVSDLLVRTAPYVGEFVATLFGVANERDCQRTAIQEELDTVFVYRNEILAKAQEKFSPEDLITWDLQHLRRQIETLKHVIAPGAHASDPERALAGVASELWRLRERCAAQTRDQAGTDTRLEQDLFAVRARIEADPEASAAFADCLTETHAQEFVLALYDRIERWSFAARHDAGLNATVANWVSFKQPKKTDFQHLVHGEQIERDGYHVLMGPRDRRRRRDGFALTDPRGDERHVLYEIDHCIYCHDRDTDSCSKGMRNRKDGTYKVNPLGMTITGCPLEEKISEMHVLKRQGDNIGALALIMIDNPMCPGTGHRICNDCMKGCIYQKTEPVNIPQVETNVLTEVLFMSWGFEIYGLFTRWNPLNVKRPVALPYNGKNVLIAGLGPAGYTFAHYLLNEGFGVVGIDGLKIEPLPRTLTGDSDQPPQPVRDFRELYEDLDTRVMTGFGGVAEYGITVRWDKNFLKVIYLTLARRRTFRCYGGIRFGGTLTVNEAWDLGFHHIAVASGAGKPTIIELGNNLMRGIRKASDFLMALQLTGAAKHSSLANLQVRLPAGVIGGGLTAIDTATELLAYYPVQVERVLRRYEVLSKRYEEQSVRARYDEEELLILDELLDHGRTICAERVRALAAGETPNFLPLLEAMGRSDIILPQGSS